MTELSRLANADAHLRAAYGTPECVESSNSWTQLLHVLLVGPVAGSTSFAVRTLVESPAFVTPKATSQMTTGQLVELLSSVPRGPQKASLLRSIAEWWLTQFGDECTPVWSQGLEFYREAFRKIRGLGPATVDELLMFVARLPVFPLDRGTVRVAVRHGWLDLPLEDDEAQNFFVGGLNEADIDRREFSRLVSRVAEAHCGREPKCDACPLQPLLPPNGPLIPDSC